MHLKPTTSQQVSDVFKALSNEAAGCWTVAIRSGDHSPFPSNNTANGVTIDLRGMSSVSHMDNSHMQGHGIAAIGTGGRWGDVYSTLNEHGVMTTGGRKGHVGVGVSHSSSFAGLKDLGPVIDTRATAPNSSSSSNSQGHLVCTTYGLRRASTQPWRWATKSSEFSRPSSWA
ncbi:FAD binding domain-containing protein [Colletotrichum fioriniae PJ7]|uniref:FAD binding domain-containing protein n=1 Tax=Colletotrichum fioriniae PJ7 TaxID=1445577 RepID=A0A010S0D1_9PEZI|nr:FAD binding domain-containing protein [Colletotrichum fioriniae PJ7]